MKNKKPAIAVIDVGKTNKKMFLFDQDYNIVYERSARFLETTDEDGDPCENLESLRLSVFDSLRSLFNKKDFDVKAINFSAYGASFVNIDEDGNPVTPLYNYLKPYPEDLKKQFYSKYGGEEAFSLSSASPVLGSLNSGMQLYRLKYEKPEVFDRIKYSLHLPQYLSYLISCNPCSDITSIGCHTNLWDFQRNDYQDWVYAEGVDQKLAPICSYDQTTKAVFPGNNYLVGTGLHDSSAALIPYMVNFHEPFVLLSTGTWCISLNPFNETPLTSEELKQDCLCYLQYQRKPVKASRLFSGPEYEEGVKRIADHFHQNGIKYRTIGFNPEIAFAIQKNISETNDRAEFRERELSSFVSDEEAYHQLLFDITRQQARSTNLVLNGSPVKRLFVDGGFGRNAVYMNFLAMAFPDLEVYAASMAQATALGAALAIHSAWNKKRLPNTLIKLQYYSAVQTATV
ncbi:MAG TPA: FGGY family carbohydrate kinase [Flavisolibacter sp.]